MNKLYICEDLGCVYRYDYTHKVLEYTPLMNDNTFYVDEFGAVDEELVGEETIVHKGKRTTFSNIYRDIEKILTPKEVKVL